MPFLLLTIVIIVQNLLFHAALTKEPNPDGEYAFWYLTNSMLSVILVLLSVLGVQYVVSK